MINSLIKNNHNYYRPAVFSSVFDQMMNEMFSTPTWFGKEKVSYPMNVVSISKDGENIGCRLEYALAGFSKDDIVLSIEGDILKIEAEHKQEQNDDESYQHNGISYRKMSASYRLMEGTDKENISCKFENGLLTITIMQKKKDESVPAARRIEIQ